MKIQDLTFKGKLHYLLVKHLLWEGYWNDDKIIKACMIKQKMPQLGHLN